MEKTILLALMAVMITTPCFAQEVEPDGLFSIEGTQWRICRVGFIINIVLFELISDCDLTLGFYDGTVYSEGEGHWRGQISYINLGVLSIAYIKGTSNNSIF